LISVPDITTREEQIAEAKLRHQMAMQVIDSGYKAQSLKLHP
jgi:hypothetical protein